MINHMESRQIRDLNRIQERVIDDENENQEEKVRMIL